MSITESQNYLQIDLKNATKKTETNENFSKNRTCRSCGCVTEYWKQYTNEEKKNDSNFKYEYEIGMPVWRYSDS